MALRSRSVLLETHRSVKDSEAFLRLAVKGYERGLERGDGLDEDAGVAIDDAVTSVPSFALCVILAR
jgi:hypothetical protein